jgi:hypothetical protein
LAHEKNVGKRHGLGVTHHGSFAKAMSHKKVSDAQGKLNRHGHKGKVR